MKTMLIKIAVVFVLILGGVSLAWATRTGSVTGVIYNITTDMETGRWTLYIKDNEGDTDVINVSDASLTTYCRMTGSIPGATTTPTETGSIRYYSFYFRQDDPLFKETLANAIAAASVGNYVEVAAEVDADTSDGCQIYAVSAGYKR